MTSDPGNSVLLVIGLVALGAAGAYFLLRYLKGSITISLPDRTYCPGEMVEGSFELLTRQEVRANSLTAALVAKETIRERGYNGRSNSRTREIFRAGQTLEHAKDYPAGYRADYNFRLAVPQLKDRAENAVGFIGQAMDMLGSAGRSVAWVVEVRLDAEGVDLASTQGVNISDSGIF